MYFHSMEIKDVKANQGNIDLVAEVKTKDSPREFEKFGKKGKVCNAVIKDKSGEITLTLWNDDIDVINVGDKVHLKNGWCSEYKGAKQLSTGKFGQIEVMDAENKGNKSDKIVSAKNTAKAAAPAVFTNDPGMLKKGNGAQEEDDLDGDDDNEEQEENYEEEFVD